MTEQGIQPENGAEMPEAQRPRGASAPRAIAALMLREMSTAFGRTSLGYLWAVVEPVAAILLMTLIFSVAFQAPGLGSSFPLFYASGVLPFLAYMDISAKIAGALRFSRQLLFYPGVKWIDAILARLFINALTQLAVVALVLTTIILGFGLRESLDLPALALALAMTFALGLGIGTLNCFLSSMYPGWERTWAILNRPLFLISCIFFVFDTVPEPWRGYLWYNPLIHLVGQMRAGIYATYDASYVSPLYVFAISLITFAFGLVMLGRYHKDILND